ncbi:putative leader peptide [Luteimicrobium subarcticum]
MPQRPTTGPFAGLLTTRRDVDLRRVASALCR